MADNALKTLNDLQSMIDIMSERLVALRDLRLQGFIKEEIRSLEGKLVKHFWRQLSAKAKIPKDQWPTLFLSYPSAPQWLSVVGVSSSVKEKLVARMSSIEHLLNLPEKEIMVMLHELGGDAEDERKLVAALGLLRRFDDAGAIQPATDVIYWDSWTKAVDNKEFDYNENIHLLDQGSCNRQPRTYAENGHEIVVHTASGRRISPEWHGVENDKESAHYGSQDSPHFSKTLLSAVNPPSPTFSRMPGNNIQPNQLANRGTATLPSNVHHSLGHSFNQRTSNALQDHDDSADAFNKFSGKGSFLTSFGPMRNARSYEWQVGSHITTSSREESMTDSNLSLASLNTLPPPPSSSSGPKLFSTRKKTKKRPGNIVIQRENFPDLIDLLRPSTAGPRRMSQSSMANSDGLATSSCGSPVSPRTPMTPGTPVINELLTHRRESSSTVPQTPSRSKGGLVKAIKDKIRDKINRSKLKRNKSEERVADDADHFHPKLRSDTCPSINVSGISHKHNPSERPTDDSRQNSTHSSTSSLSSNKLSRMHTESSSFDVSFITSGITTPGEACLLSDRDNFGFDASMSYVPPSVPAPLEETEVSTLTDDDLMSASAGLQNDEDTAEEKDGIMRANLMRQTSTMSAVLEEWDIPWDELVLQERIGQGRVGLVYKGKWHGEVAIRVIDICHNDEFKLRAFKNEVMLYKKTRHDNVELFMGSCMNPPRLAIITGYCRGKSLYHYIRSSKEPVNLNVSKIISQHVALGMGYLHSRKIIHKDLKSKNIFLDGKRVTITDFGLMGLHAIATQSMQIKPQTLQIPDGWLCYMAPEIIRALRVPAGTTDVVSSLPYTKESDVFAFGTVWYELLTSCWPFDGYPSESVIWQVGNGKKQSLAHLQGAKELKDILMKCWCYDPAQRPDFSDTGIIRQIVRLPQAKIIRRSSQPIKGNKKGGRLGTVGNHDRLFDHNFASILHEHAEHELQ